MLQEAAVGGCNDSGGSFNIGGYNGGSGYNGGGYRMVACSALYKQLCWKFGVSHKCVCIIPEGPLIYVVTCLETFCYFNRLFKVNVKIHLQLTFLSLSTSHCGASDLPLYY